MNREIKAKWVAALRSGEYSQGKNYLRTNEGFCCLGVLCDLHRKEMQEGDWHYGGTLADGTRKYHVYLEAGSFLPSRVMDWAGLHECNPFLIDLQDSLSGLNDRGKTFEEIADVIEKKVR